MFSSTAGRCQLYRLFQSFWENRGNQVIEVSWSSDELKTSMDLESENMLQSDMFNFSKEIVKVFNFINYSARYHLSLDFEIFDHISC